MLAETVVYSILACVVCRLGITLNKIREVSKAEKENFEKIGKTQTINKRYNHYINKSYSDEVMHRVTTSDMKNLISRNKIQGYAMIPDKNEADKFVEKIYGNWIDNLSNKYTEDDDELNPYNSLIKYGGNSYRYLNEYLRGNITDRYLIEYFNDMDKNMERAFSNVPKIENNIVVFRRISLDMNNHQLKKYYYSLKKDDIIREKAYMSTSIFVEVAINIHNEKIDSSFALLAIKIPKYEKCIFMGGSLNDCEYEILINKNKALKVEDILVKNDKQIVLLCTL